MIAVHPFTVYHRAKRGVTNLRRNCVLSQGLVCTAIKQKKSCFAVDLASLILFRRTCKSALKVDFTNSNHFSFGEALCSFFSPIKNTSRV